MSSSRQFWNAIILAVISIASVLGVISLSLAENVSTETQFIPTPTDTQNAFSVPTLVTITPTLPAPVNSPIPSDTPLPTNNPVPTASCPTPPSGWIPIITHSGDTLEIIAIIYKTNAQDLRAVNCLLVDTLLPNTTLYVPPLISVSASASSASSITTTVAACGSPAGWVKTYVVQHGDTLFSISQSFGVPLATLQHANCIGTDYLIITGQLLWVPNVPTRTPTTSFYPTATYFIATNPTEPLTATYLPYTATIYPTNTSLPLTSTPLPTLTPFP